MALGCHRHDYPSLNYEAPLSGMCAKPKRQKALAEKKQEMTFSLNNLRVGALSTGQNKRGTSGSMIRGTDSGNLLLFGVYLPTNRVLCIIYFKNRY